MDLLSPCVLLCPLSFHFIENFLSSTKKKKLTAYFVFDQTSDKSSREKPPTTFRPRFFFSSPILALNREIKSKNFLRKRVLRIFRLEVMKGPSTF